MTIKEIARLAGVSSAAVSRYLNGGYVSEEKKEKIREIIEKTGYRPSIQARNLRTRQTRLVGVVVPKISSETISRVTDGIGKILQEKGYQMLLATTDNNPEKELEYMELFENYPVDGVILIATILTRKHRKHIRETKIPIVVIGQHLEGENCVYHDDICRKIRQAEDCIYWRNKGGQSGRNRKRGRFPIRSCQMWNENEGRTSEGSKVYHGVRL